MLRNHKCLDPSPDASAQMRVLLIRDTTNRTVYRADVLKRAGFFARAITDADFPALLNDDAVVFNVVVMCHSLKPEDVQNFTLRLRQRNARTKVILISGAESCDVDPSSYDLLIDSLAGPEALIIGVQRLCAEVTG